MVTERKETAMPPPRARRPASVCLTSASMPLTSAAALLSGYAEIYLHNRKSLDQWSQSCPGVTPEKITQCDPLAHGQADIRAASD